MGFLHASSYRRPVAAAMLLALCLLIAPRAQAAEKHGNSLDLIPADASFYSGSLRMKEQVDILLSSKAWARLLEMPAVKMALGMAKAELEKPGGPKEQWDRSMENPDNQRLVEVLKEMVSEEAFVYGDKQFADSLALLVDVINVAQYSPLFNKLANQGADTDDDKVALMALLQTLSDNLDRLKVPDLVIGFKINDPAKADLQIRRLETLINVVVQLLTINELKDRFGRVSVGGHDFIELRLDGRLVPWEELPFGEYAEDPGDYEKLKQHLRSMKLVIDLGVRDGYVLFSIGDSNEHLVNLGKGELLINRPEMKALREALIAASSGADGASGTPSKKLVGVGYASKEMNAFVTGKDEDIDELLDMARQFVPYTDLDDEVQKRILADAEALANEIKQLIPEPGPSASFSFLTPRGYESYSYNWTQNQLMDDSKRLTLLDHVGGNPVLAVIARSKYSPEQYDMVVKWAKKGYGYFEEFGLPRMPPEEQAKFRHVAQLAIPLLRRIDAATRNDLIPGLADGQAGLVVDADITSMRWHSGMPSLGKPLPAPEIALVFGVSDEERVKKAFGEYKAVAQAAVDKISELNPEAIPKGFQIPPPQSRVASDGQVYWYPVPKSSDFHVDPQVQPAVGLSKNVAVVSTSIQQVERILAPTPLARKSDVITARKTAGSALCFDFPALVDAVRPWAELAVAQHASESDDENADAQAKAIIEQIGTGAEILKCYRGTTSVTYGEDGATVTHRESVFEDLK
jgi:hypothetical protein